MGLGRVSWAFLHYSFKHIESEAMDQGLWLIRVGLAWVGRGEQGWLG